MVSVYGPYGDGLPVASAAYIDAKPIGRTRGIRKVMISATSGLPETNKGQIKQALEKETKVTFHVEYEVLLGYVTVRWICFIKEDGIKDNESE